MLHAHPRARHAGYQFAVLARGFVIHFPHPKSASKQKWLHSNAHGRVEQLFSKFEQASFTHL